MGGASSCVIDYSSGLSPSTVTPAGNKKGDPSGSPSLGVAMYAGLNLALQPPGEGNDAIRHRCRERITARPTGRDLDRVGSGSVGVGMLRHGVTLVQLQAQGNPGALGFQP